MTANCSVDRRGDSADRPARAARRRVRRQPLGCGRGWDPGRCPPRPVADRRRPDRRPLGRREPWALETASGHTQIDGPTGIDPTADTESTRQIATDAVKTILVDGDASALDAFLAGEDYVQHNPRFADGVSGLLAALTALAAQGITMKYDQITHVAAEGDFAYVRSEGKFGDEPFIFHDLFRVDARTLRGALGRDYQSSVGRGIAPSAPERHAPAPTRARGARCSRSLLPTGRSPRVREAVAEHEQPAEGFGPRGFFLPNVPVLGKQAVLHPYDIDGHHRYVVDAAESPESMT